MLAKERRILRYDVSGIADSRLHVISPAHRWMHDAVLDRDRPAILDQGMGKEP